jgi:hypothetical protein
MKPKRKRRPETSNHVSRGRSRIPPGARWWLVLIDDAPLRDDAASQCRRRFQLLRNARASWQHFERHDRPAFARWRAATFGQQLTELRTLADRMAELERLFAEVDEEAFFGNYSPKTAYHRVMRARNRASAEVSSARDESSRERVEDNTDDFAPDEDDPPDDSEASFEEMIEEKLFYVFARKELKIDPDTLPEELYEALLAEFRRTFLGSGRRHKAPPPIPPNRFEREAPRPHRLKDLYRQLVRRLHPDTRRESDPGLMHLWHEVQEAYAAGDVDRLETLQALTDIHEDAVGRHTPLSRLKAALREIESALRALQKSLRGARKTLEWNFSRTGPTPSVEKTTARQIERELRSARREVADYEAIVARWQEPPKKKKKKNKKVATGEVPVAVQEWMFF